MQGNERWPPSTPSARLRSARVMPPWMQARGSAIPPPPPPPQNPPPVEPEYEVIEFGQQTYSNQPAIRSNQKEKERKRCDLCGSSVPAVKCMQCVQQNFCYSCDEMYHRHPKRQSHIRKELDGGKLPPLPPKGEPPPPPVPPPRRNKRATPRPSPTPPNLPPAPSLQRDSVSPKPGFVGSLKRMVGARPLPLAPHTMDRQNTLPPSSSMMNFHDHQQMMNGFTDWTDMHRNHRSGSFSALNPPNFGTMMQAQSMAQLNCPSCHGHGMWNGPWGGMGVPGGWQSQAMVNRGREDLSDSDSDSAWQRERLRRFSTMSARAPRGFAFDDTASHKGGRKRQDFDTMSTRGGSSRRQELDTMSVRGGRRSDLETMSNRGGRRQDFDTLSTRGGRKQDFDTMSLRGGRRSDIDSPSFRSRKYSEDKSLRSRQKRDSYSSDERESDEDFVPTRGGKKIMSDLEDIQRGRRRSEPPSPLPMLKKTDSLPRKKSKRNERFTDTGRRRSSPVSYKYESPSGEEDDQEKELEMANGHDTSEKVENGIEYIDADAAEEEEDEELASIPDTEWECLHCTYINEPGIRVCAVCCKTSTKPKSQKIQSKTQQKAPSKPQPPKMQNKPQSKPQSPITKPEDDLKKLSLEDKQPKEETSKTLEKSEKNKEKRGTVSPERNPRTHTMSTGTSPPPQSISTQTYEEGGRKLTRATSLADYSDWKPPQRSASRQSLLSDTQNFKRAGSQPPEYLSTLVQKQVKQGLEMVKLLREAEENQFAAEDLAIALLHCEDSDPIVWLQENWRNMIDTVVTLGTNYGQERKENIVGTISASEAREALRMHDGNVWAAVTECVEQRQKKYAELLSRGNFSREDIVTVLTANHGNLEEAYKELNKNQLKPFLMRIWGPPQGADNDDGDFTKLAHGEVEGRGGKNSEEVSVDLSIDSNYERIQSWLEDYVHSNNKLNVSQSMLHVNTGGLKRSASDWKVNNPLINSRSSSTLFKDRRNSDIHRYLTTLYNANDKTLLINKHSTSTLNLFSAKNTDSIIDNDKQQKPSFTRLSSEKAKSEDNYGEIETITIKLNPTVIKSGDENLQPEEQNDKAESDSSESSSEESESESESSEDEDSHEVSNTLKADVQYLQVETKPVNKTASVSEKQSERSESQQALSRSDSQSSSESFESVHSSADSEENTNKAKANGENHVADNIIKHVNSLVVPGTAYSSRSHSSEPDSHDYANVIVNRLGYLSSPSPSDNISEGILEKSPFRETENLIQIDIDAEHHVGPSENKSPTLLQKGSPVSSLSSNEKYEEVSSDDDIPFIEDASDNLPMSDTIKIPQVPVAVIDEASDNESDDSNFHSSEIIIEEKKYDKRNRNYIGKSSGNLLVPNKRRVMAKRQRQHYAMSKSDSDINDERSVDFSEESLDFNEGKRSSPLTALKRDPSLRFSEGNSDRDVSSIPTDSEKEPVTDLKERNLNDNMKNALQASQAELLELLKKSLSKDDVVEKLVSTLFASVLQASVDSNVFKEQQKFIESKKTFPQIANDTAVEKLDSGVETPKQENTELKNVDIFIDGDENHVAGEQLKYVNSGEIDLINDETNTTGPSDPFEKVIVDEQGHSIHKDNNVEIVNDFPSNIHNEIASSLLSDNINGEITNLAEDKELVTPRLLEEITITEPQNHLNIDIGITHNYVAEEANSQEDVNKVIGTNGMSSSFPDDNSENHKKLALQVSKHIENEIFPPNLSPSQSQILPGDSNSLQDIVNMNAEPEEEEVKTQSKEMVPVTEEKEELETYSSEREARRLLAEGLVKNYDQAVVAVQLKELKLDDEMILAAANECSSLEAAVAYLQQECQLCAGKYSAKQMVSMLECEHVCCTECASNYFTLQITERSINDCVCPFCKEPDIIHIEEDKALTYFSNLDIFLKRIVKENIHELFQRKLRDRTLMQDPNFKWCVKCSSGFIANPRQKRFICPDCKAITCAKCMKPWEKEHENMSCEEYKTWYEQNDPEHQLTKHIDENGVTCPKCKSKYILAKGGCMHLTCPQCKHEFCSGCTKPFLLGKKCTVSEYCEKLGLHSHHPRNCLFYLRDKEPEELERLLEENNIAFNKTVETETKRCSVQILKETPDGMKESICGYATVKAGFCRTHYIENLATRIQLNKLDPVKLLDFQEAVQELRRNGKTLPQRPANMSEFNYRQILYKVIEKEIPLD